MNRLYGYEGQISSISFGEHDIVLSDAANYNKPPVRITVNPAFHYYIWTCHGLDDEERYIKSTWVYDRALNLIFIEIPSTQKGRPAKVIAMSDPTRYSQFIVTFGPHGQLQDEDPEPMSNTEFQRWQDFRNEHHLNRVRMMD